MESYYPTKFNVAVLIPCFDNRDGLVRSVNSIKYSFDDLIVIIVDDGSNDPIIPQFLLSQINNQFNFVVLRNESNAGITKALNLGLDYIANNLVVNYVARLDCGDTCHPDRFYRQVALMDSRPSINFSGSWCLFRDFTSDVSYRYITPTSHLSIKRSMYFRNVFIHPSVMWRWRGNECARYPEEFPFAEDYGFFYTMLSRGEGAVINDFLVTCEINHNGISLRNRRAQMKSRKKVIRRFTKRNWLYFLGMLKLNLLLLIPGNFVLSTKKLLFRQ